MTGSKGTANFTWRCRHCKREHSASITAGPFAYTASEDGKVKRQKVIEMDCRGLEFVDFKADVRERH